VAVDTLGGKSGSFPNGFYGDNRNGLILNRRNFLGAGCAAEAQKHWPFYSGG
jgi:hypothetical protein